MLTLKQIKSVENSWDYILLNSLDTGVIFYNKLFELDPGLRQLFKGDINTQSQKLVAMITIVVHKLNNLDEIISDVKEMGIQHQKNLAQPQHYNTVASALIWALENALGKEWNEEVKESWTALYKTLSKKMMDKTQIQIL
jgi:nitric oxide dioxygenase